MKIQQVQEYNADDMRRYEDKLAEWKKGGDFKWMPQIAFFCFRRQNGDLRMSGYVASDDNRAFWAKTKKEAIKRFEA